MRIIGDIHGKVESYMPLTVGVSSIQVGDFGIGFVDFPALTPNSRFIRGNHDNPHMCKSHANCIADGTVEDDVMFIGGAWSIDQAFRQEGVSWWREEELSITEWNRIFDVYQTVKPRVLITHDCPTSIAWDMFISRGNSLNGNNQIKSRTGEALQALFEVHQPEFHFFGHWHQTRDFNMHGTRFVCLGELDFVDVELNDSDQIHSALDLKFRY